jgi:cystathionine beta-lyase/cystathionine gamma-synthase
MNDGEGAATRSVHGGERPDPSTGSLTTPIWRTSTFRFETTADLIAGAKGERPGFYTRYGHPNFEAVETKFALLHGGPAAVLFSSGLASIAGVLFGHLRTGDRVVALRDLYGGTRGLLGEMADRFGIGVEFAPSGDEAALARALTGARLLVAESPTNPTLKVLDVPRLARAAHEAGALFLFDNTFATPVNQQPLRHGVDLVMESATKALGGHSDLVGGLVAGRSELVEPIRRARKLFGAIHDPDAAWLLGRGMKTLPARVERQNRTGAEVAAFLEGHPAVARVWYPGLPSHPDHALAKRLLSGFGGIVTFACRGGPEAARRVADGVRLIANAPSLGGVESMLSLPLHTSHAMFSASERAAAGITDDLVRLSLGLEDPADLIADLDQALARAGQETLR